MHETVFVGQTCDAIERGTARHPINVTAQLMFNEIKHGGDRSEWVVRDVIESECNLLIAPRPRLHWLETVG